MSHFDANGDKKITQQEFVEKPNPAFPHVDRNNDCNMTFVELTAGQKGGPNTLSRDDLLEDRGPN